MMNFDHREPLFATLDYAGIRSGDVLQYRGQGWISSMIQLGSQGVHSHSAIARVDMLGRADVLEVRELKGGRAVPLLGEVEKHPGRIDVFRPRLDVFAFDIEAAVDMMRTLTSRSYGYAGVARLAIQRLPLLWRLSRLQTADVVAGNESRSPFCSHAVAIACTAGGVDPVPRKPDDAVTPADLTTSLLFEYVCTLVP